MVSNSISPSLTPQLGNAWQRMKHLLFMPFNLQQWFVVGFGAFLVSLADAGDGIFKISDRLDRDSSDYGLRDIEGLYDRVISEAWLIMLVGFLMILGLILGVLFLWLSSRGRFVLTDNLVNPGSGFESPWRTYSSQGTSLFWWELGFALVCLVVFGIFAGLLVALFLPLGILDAGAVFMIPAVALAASLGLVLMLAAIYIEFFLHNFIVTIMYRDKVSATEAWRRFTPLFHKYPGWFVLYGLFYLLMAFIGFVALMIGGALTCCIGLILLIIPYIGSVVSLPVTVTLRYWDLEFLGQFGPEFTVLGPKPTDPDHESVYTDGDRTVVGSEDLGEDSGPRESGSQDS